MLSTVCETRCTVSVGAVVTDHVGTVTESVVWSVADALALGNTEADCDSSSVTEATSEPVTVGDSSDPVSVIVRTDAVSSVERVPEVLAVGSDVAD